VVPPSDRGSSRNRRVSGGGAHESEDPDPSGASAEKSSAESTGAIAERLSLGLPVQVDLAHVAAAFGDEAQTWLGEPAGTDPAGLRRYRGDLRLRVSPEGRALFRKSAIVSLGAATEGPDGWTVPIEWRAATLAPLFPVFVGHLLVRADRILIDGYYAPPFGVIGHVMDHAVMSIVARGTARWFLTQVAGALR
jgi:hypothetical protein